MIHETSLKIEILSGFWIAFDSYFSIPCFKTVLLEAGIGIRYNQGGGRAGSMERSGMYDITVRQSVIKKSANKVQMLKE